LLPLTLGLGAGVFVIISHRYGEAAGVAAGLGLTVVGVGLLYGLGYALKRPRGNERMSEQAETKLSTKIEQMLTEARVVIPGAQALLGFQFIAFLTQSFSELPLTFQIVHMLGLFAVALAALLLMTPAAVHRIAYGGEDDETFFRFGSAMIIAAALPLAAGIAADVAVVTYKTSENTATALSAGVAALCLLLLTWFALPLMLRRQQPLSIFVQTFSRR
jgi:glucan phosphorylase